MQSLDGVRLHLVGAVVLLVAGRPAAELAEKYGLFVELVDLEFAGGQLGALRFLHDKSNRGC